MLNHFDQSVITKYGKQDLIKICNANMKVVPENIIESMRNAIAMEGCAADKEACWQFLSWDHAKFEFQNKSVAYPIITLFNIMRNTSQPSCKPVCIDPNSHFKVNRESNRCYPIGKVYQVLFKICVNAANQLLDVQLVDDIHKEIKMAEYEEKLQIYNIKNRKLAQSNILSRIINGKAFNVLLVNMDMLISSQNKSPSSNPTLITEDEYTLLFSNLVANLNHNFNYTLLTKPEIRLPWTDYVENHLHQADVIVILLSSRMMKFINEWKYIVFPKQFNSLNSDSNVCDLQRFEEDQIDKSLKYSYVLWKKLSRSDKVKVAITFESGISGQIKPFIPFVFVLPDRMRTFLSFIDEVR